MRKETVNCPGVPRPVLGSQAVKAGDFVFLGGQIPSDFQNGIAPEARQARADGITVIASKLQSEYILQNSRKILEAAGSSLALGVRIDQFCTHPSAASPYLEVRSRHIDPGTRPSSTHIQIASLLVPGALSSLQLIALSQESGLKKEIVFIPDMSTSPGPPFKPSPQGLTAGDWVFVTGQVASEFARGVAPSASTNPDFWYGSPVKLQTDYVLKRCEKILNHSGSSLANVVRSDIYLTDMADIHEFEEVWRQYFPAEPPARTFIPVTRLGPKDCIVEINMIALKNDSPQKRETITSREAPAPGLHQPHAVRAGEFLFISGMYATDFGEGLAPEARLHPEMPWFGSAAKKQTDYILKNMAAVCRAGGTGPENMVWTQNFYTDLGDFHPSQEVWHEYFPKDPPAAFVGGVKSPHLIPDCTILIDGVAVMGE